MKILNANISSTFLLAAFAGCFVLPLAHADTSGRYIPPACASVSDADLNSCISSHYVTCGSDACACYQGCVAVYGLTNCTPPSGNTCNVPQDKTKITTSLYTASIVNQPTVAPSCYNAHCPQLKIGGVQLPEPCMTLSCMPMQDSKGNYIWPGSQNWSAEQKSHAQFNYDYVVSQMKAGGKIDAPVMGYGWDPLVAMQERLSNGTVKMPSGWNAQAGSKYQISSNLQQNSNWPGQGGYFSNNVGDIVISTDDSVYHAGSSKTSLSSLPAITPLNQWRSNNPLYTGNPGGVKFNAPPSVKIMNPLSGLTVSGNTLAVNALATPTAPGASILASSLYMDNNTTNPVWQSQQSGTYRLTLPMDTMAAGAHTLTLVAQDSLGQKAVSTVTFNIGAAASTSAGTTAATTPASVPSAGASSVAPASPAASATTNQANQDFVTALYLNCLGRPADLAGLTNWTASLNKGTVTQTSIVPFFLHSSERQASCAANSDAAFCQDANCGGVSVMAAASTPAATAAPAAMATGAGYVDQINCSVIGGWAFDSAHPNDPATITVKVSKSGVVVQQWTLPANLYRADLLGALGSANHAFSQATPASLLTGTPYQVTVSLTSNGLQLPASNPAVTGQITCKAP